MSGQQTGASPSQPELRFVSARDTWLVVVLWLSVGMLAASVVPVLREPLAGAFRAGYVLLAVASGAFMLWVLYGTYYVLEPDALRVRSGPFRWQVRWDQITEVVPSRNPLSSPACSLDRLQIRFAGSRWGMLVSPEDRPRFLQAVAARAPQLRLEGDRLTS